MTNRTCFTLAVFIAFMSLQLTNLAKASDDLSKEGLIRQSAHRYLMGAYLKGRKATFHGEGAGRILDEVLVESNEINVKHGDEITLPKGTQLVAGMFRYLAFRGRNLDKIEGIQVLPFAEDSHPHKSKQEADFYRVQMPSMPLPVANLPDMIIRFELPPDETITISQTILNSHGRLSTTFDDIPYRNLGSEFPRDNVSVHVDLKNELSIDGIVDLQRHKWFRYYATPGGVHHSFERWANERNFLPGRQIFKLHPALVRGYSKNQAKLREIQGQPGKPDLTFFDGYDSSGAVTRAIEPFKNIDYAMCFDEWPQFMSRQPNGRGTPLVENFSDAAQLVAAYVADQIRDGGQTATWWEVKNESTIKAEWDYHWENDQSWDLLADFHNQVAEAIHKVNPDVKVGGPASAWMQVQVKDFELYRNQANFIKNTKGQLDFYSHHYYENIGSLGAFERRGANYTNYLLGRFEAITDMLRAQMHNVESVRPMLITECGSLQPGRSQSDNWLRLRSWSAYLTKFMQRPDQFDLTVPFVFLQIPWAPTSGDAAFTPKKDKSPNGSIDDFDATPIANFFELWKDFDGRRLPVKHSRQWLDAVAVYDGNQISIALCNMGGRRLAVDLSSIAKQTEVELVTQTRLYYHDGEVQFENKKSQPDLTKLPVNVEETAIVTVKCKEAIKPIAARTLKRHYALETAVKLDKSPTHFKIQIDENDIDSDAFLIIGLQSDTGTQDPLKIEFNGQPMNLTKEWTAEFKHLFAPCELTIPNDQLKPLNEIVVLPQAGLTVTSVQIQTLSK